MNLERALRRSRCVAIVAVMVATWVAWASTPTRVDAIDAGIDEPARCCAHAVRLDPPSPPPPPPTPTSPIVIVGDSLTVGVVTPILLGSGNTLVDRLQAIGALVLADAANGRTTSRGTDVIRTNAATVAGSAVLLVGLGVNDLAGPAGGSVADSSRLIVDLVNTAREIRGDLRIIWVEVSVDRHRTDPIGWQQRSDVWNAALGGVARQFDDFEICRWRDLVRQHPEWTAGDGVHLTTQGYQALRDVMFGCVVERSR